MNPSPFDPSAEVVKMKSIVPGKKRSLVWYIAPLVVAGGAWLVVRAKGKPEDALAARDVPVMDGNVLRFSPGFAKRAGIEFAEAEQAPISPIVTVTGTVTFDPEKVASVGPRITGRIRRVLKFEGDAVKAGDILAEMESAEYGQAQSAVLSARAHLEAAVANEKRETGLAEAHVNSQRDAELAKANATAARAELHAAEQKVKAFGGGGVGGEIGILYLTSPIEGKVVEHKVSRGQSVEASMQAFRVADLSRVWVELAVFEKELQHIKEQDKVDITTQSNADVLLAGNVAHVGDVIDIETRSSGVRVVVVNANRALRPGQSVVAKIHTSRTGGKNLLVERDAVTTIDGKPTLFVSLSDTSVEPRSVVIGGRDGKRTEIMSGLQPGERVVVKGVFALKSEVFR